MHFMPVEATIRSNVASLQSTGKGHDAEAGADRAQIGGDEEGAVLGEQPDAVAAARALAPAAGRPSRTPRREARRR